MHIPIGTKAFILSKHYYSVLSKTLECIDIERYFSVLYFLNEKEGCIQQHICNNLAIDKTAMVKVIDYLIKAGLVTREPNPEDRREYFIMLTKKGKKQTEETVKAFKALDDKIFSKISDTDKETFIKVMNQLTTELKELPANDLFFNYRKTAKKKS